MERPLRLEYGGAVYQITSRVDARGPMHFDDKGRRVFLDILKRVRKGP